MSCEDCSEHSGLLATIEAIREHHQNDVKHMESFQVEILEQLKSIQEALHGNGSVGLKAKMAVCIWSIGILGLTNGVLWGIIITQRVINGFS